MNTDWNVIYVLPNIQFDQTFETEHIALVPCKDERINKIRATLKEADKFLNSFIDDMNRKVEPTVLIVNANAPKKVFSVEALVAFRNIVALTIIFKGWSMLRYKGSSSLSPLFSDFFNFYPVTLGKNGSILALTPALNSFRDASDPFIGMASSHISQVLNGGNLSFDEIIYNKLVEIWNYRYVDPALDEQRTRRIFRSMEMVYHALSVPNKNEATTYDYGLNISLWVSAFEILAHPYHSKVTQTKVLELLSNYEWESRLLSLPRYKAKISKNRSDKVNLIQKAYKCIYDARNAFLHGNNINKNTLYFRGNPKFPLWVLAPIIYRTALYSYLLKFKYIKTNKKWKDMLSYANAVLDRVSQKEYEKFLLQIVNKTKYDHP